MAEKLTARLAAKILRLSARHVRRLIRDGKLCATKSHARGGKSGKIWVVNKDSLQKYLIARSKGNLENLPAPQLAPLHTPTSHQSSFVGRGDAPRPSPPSYNAIARQRHSATAMQRDSSTMEANGRSSEGLHRRALAPMSLSTKDMERLAALADWQRNAALLRFEILARYEQEISPSATGANRSSIISAYLSEAGISERTLYRLRKAYRESGIFGLIPQWKGRSTKLSKDERAFIALAYSRSNQPSVRDVYELYLAESKRRGWSPASYCAVRRAIEKIPHEQKILYRLGPKEFSEQCVASIFRTTENLRVMELVVADHRIFDVFVKGTNGRPTRPWLTALMDMRSRMIVGWCISYRPSSETIAIAIRRMVERYGVCEKLLIDNGLDFKSQRILGKSRVLDKNEQQIMSGLLFALGIKPIIALPYHPQSKPIESNFRLIKEKFDRRLEAFCGGEPSERPFDMKMRLSRGLMTLDEFAKLFGAWVDEVWAVRAHGGAGMEKKSPKEMFESAEKFEGSKIINGDALWFICAKRKIVTRQRDGIFVFGSWYRSDELFAKTNLGDKLLVFFEGDTKLSQLWVGDIKGQLVCKVERVSRVGWGIDVGQYEAKRRYQRILKAKCEQANAAKSELYRITEQFALGLPDGVTPEPTGELPVLTKPAKIEVDFDELKKASDPNPEIDPAVLARLLVAKRKDDDKAPLLLSDCVNLHTLSKE